MYKVQPIENYFFLTQTHNFSVLNWKLKYHFENRKIGSKF